MGEVDAETIRALLARPIAFNRALVPVAGSINAALMLSQIIYWQGKRDGWFYKSANEWMAETGMTLDELKGAKKLLVASGVIQTQLRSMPAVTHYRVDFDRLAGRLRETHQPDGGNSTNKVAGIPPACEGESHQLLKNQDSTKTPRERRRERRTPLPEGFTASPRVMAWAKNRGFTEPYVAQCLEAFTSDARAHGRLYVDWDEALMGWIRRQPQFDRSAPTPAPAPEAPLQCEGETLPGIRCTNHGARRAGNVVRCSACEAAHQKATKRPMPEGAKAALRAIGKGARQ